MESWSGRTSTSPPRSTTGRRRRRSASTPRPTLCSPSSPAGCRPRRSRTCTTCSVPGGPSPSPSTSLPPAGRRGAVREPELGRHGNRADWRGPGRLHALTRSWVVADVTATTVATGTTGKVGAHDGAVRNKTAPDGAGDEGYEPTGAARRVG